jgi:hypothetical protein
MSALHEVAQLIRRHNTDESFTDDAEQVVQAITKIIDREAAVTAAEQLVLQRVSNWVSRQPPERHDHEHIQGIIDAQQAVLAAKRLGNRSQRTHHSRIEVCVQVDNGAGRVARLVTVDRADTRDETHARAIAEALARGYTNPTVLS